jgi:hypothetical protein
MITRPFDESTYPIELPPALAEIIAFAREQANAGQSHVTNQMIAEHFDITLNAAYKRTRRLRDLGIFRSHLMWITRNGGSYAARQSNGELWSWLELYLQPLDRWGDQPDDVQTNFDPRRNGNGKE